MTTQKFILNAFVGSVILLCMQSCIDNNNKNGGGQDGAPNETNYEQQAPTYNKTREDVEDATDTVVESKRVPKDPVERKSKGNASSK